VGSEDDTVMTGPQLEQRQDSNQQPDLSAQNPATSAAITLAPKPLAPTSEARPAWQKWGAIAAGLLALGGLGWLAWWFLLRMPPKPFVLDFSPANSRYDVTEQQPPTLNWRISNPNQVDTLTVRTLDREGALVGEPQTFDLGSSLPVNLLPYCTETNRDLTCQGVPTSVRQPGQYTFELALLPRPSLNLPPVSATSSVVTIADMPAPAVVELAPQQVIYSEAGTQVSANTPNVAPPVTQAGILVSWMVSNPQTLQDLLLIVKQADGAAIGGRRFTFRDPEAPDNVAVPQELQPFCRLEDTLVCQGVPTGMAQVGKYQFELTAVPVGLEEEGVIPESKLSETVEIQPRPVRIAAFTVNGQDAQPKYLIPVDQGQPIPGFRIGWQVEGGSTAKVELLPSPGSVGLQGNLPLPLSPEPGTTTMTLRVTDGQNPPILRAVTFETFDPTPNPPVIVNPVGQAEPSQSRSQPQQASESTPPRAPLGDLLQQEATQRETRESTPSPFTDQSPEGLNLGF
jgi:hypothetical protein